MNITYFGCIIVAYSFLSWMLMWNAGVKTEVLRVYSACCLWRGFVETCASRPRVFSIPSQNTVCICSWFRICLAMSQLCIDLSSKYDRDSCSLRFSARIWNYSPLPRQLMSFSFQICLGSTDSHTLVYFFSVSCFMVFVLSGRATVMNSTLLLFIKKQISLVCVPRVFEFIDMILFQ